jgi:hypothetical protein
MSGRHGLTAAMGRTLVEAYRQLAAGQTETTVATTAGRLAALQLRELLAYDVEGAKGPTYRKRVTLTDVGIRHCARLRYCPRCTSTDPAERLTVKLRTVETPCPCRWHDDQVAGLGATGGAR